VFLLLGLSFVAMLGAWVAAKMAAKRARKEEEMIQA
jgi:hypothetical protein